MLFPRKICFSFELNILLLLSLVEFETLAELCDRHLFHETMTSSFSRIKAFSSLDRDLLKLSDLSNKLSFLGKFGSLFILTFLQGLLQVSMNFISDSFVVLLLENDLLSGGIFIGLNLSNDFFLLHQDLVHFFLSPIHHYVHLMAHFSDELHILFFFALSCRNGFLSRQFHLNFLLLDVLKALDFILLTHLCFPSIEFRGILQAHSHGI